MGAKSKTAGEGIRHDVDYRRTANHVDDVANWEEVLRANLAGLLECVRVLRAYVNRLDPEKIGIDEAWAVREIMNAMSKSATEADAVIERRKAAAMMSARMN